jgi:hypothetical protein
MLIQKLKLIHKYGDYYDFDPRPGWWCLTITMRILRSTFELPEKPRRLWLEAHDEPAEDRARVRVRSQLTSVMTNERFVIVIEGKRLLPTGPVPCPQPLKSLVGKTVFLEVWYED